MGDVLRFRIYYGNGSTYSVDPFFAPGPDTQIIVIEDPCDRGFILQMKSDAYCWRGERFWGCDMAGMHDYLAYYLGPQKTLLGRTMAVAGEFDALVARAMSEGLG